MVCTTSQAYSSQSMLALAQACTHNETALTRSDTPCNAIRCPVAAQLACGVLHLHIPSTTYSTAGIRTTACTGPQSPLLLCPAQHPDDLSSQTARHNTRSSANNWELCGGAVVERDLAALPHSSLRVVQGRAVGLDPAARELLLEDGSCLPYDRLCLCTGATPRVRCPPARLLCK